MEMFDDLVETKISGDEKVKVKRYITDEETLAQMEMQEACEVFVVAEKKFEKIDRKAKAQEGIPDNLCEWFDSLEERYQTEKRMWQLFTAGDGSPRSGRMYLDFRKALLSGDRTRADA